MLPVLLLQGRQGDHHLAHLSVLADLLQEGGHLAAVLAAEGGQVEGGQELGAGVEGQEHIYILELFNRPSVAGAFLETPPLLTD